MLVTGKTRKATCAYQFVQNASMVNALHLKYVDVMRDTEDLLVISIAQRDIGDVNVPKNAIASIIRLVIKPLVFAIVPKDLSVKGVRKNVPLIVSV